MYVKAEKKKSKLRLAIFGVAGSGKTMTSLRIAKGIGGKVALIDTEKGSAAKYADRFDFDIAELETPIIDNYIIAISTAQSCGYDVLIIDSLSHGWQELLDEVNRIAKAKFKGNTFSAWSEGTPKQRKLINAILSFRGHLIATMRSKTEYALNNDNGKMQPSRVGLSPEQGKDIEYEFDMLMEISQENIARVLKDRTGKYQEAIIEKPGEELGKSLITWLNEGVETTQAEMQKNELIRQFREIAQGVELNDRQQIFLKDIEKRHSDDIASAIDGLRKLKAKLQQSVKDNQGGIQ